MRDRMVQRYTSIMNNFDRVASFYQNHIEQISLSVDAVVAATSVAAEAAAATIFSERKLIICGLGLDAASATLLSELLRNGLAHERPALPTIELISRFSIPKEGSVNWLAQQLAVLGQPEDMAIIFACDLDATDAEVIANAAHRRSIKTCWLGAEGPDICLSFDSDDPKVSLSMGHSAAICLADLIELAMFGPMEESL